MKTLALAGAVLGWAAVTLACAAALTRRAKPVLTATNHRGVKVPLSLGLPLVLLVLWVNGVRGRWFLDSPIPTTTAQRLAIGGSLLIVFLAGWYDDARGGPARGLRAHLGGLAKGQITPGVVKLVTIVGAAALASITLSGEPARIWLGIPVIAGSANLWNLLDVRPGRALKFFLVGAAVLVAWYARFDDLLLVAAIGSAVAVLPLDIRERAMLGDAGSNLLGFVVGIALFRVLPAWGLGIAFALILVLHGLGETVTLSRVIDGAPPLRWFDRLARIPYERPADRETGQTGSAGGPTGAGSPPI